jgi:uncharacterized lipoprotein YbaY
MTDDSPPRLVHGRVVLPPEIPHERAGTVRVQVEDVSRLDAPSTVVAEQRIEDVDIEASSEVPFALEVPAGPGGPGRHYSVRVHIDVTVSGEVTKGDYVSTAAYPVLAEDAEQREVVVTVRRV